jgi:hypothetical protein
MKKHVGYFQSLNDSSFRKKGEIYKSIGYIYDGLITFEIDDEFNKNKWRQLDYEICDLLDGVACYNFDFSDFIEIINTKQTLAELQKELLENAGNVY